MQFCSLTPCTTRRACVVEVVQGDVVRRDYFCQTLMLNAEADDHNAFALKLCLQHYASSELHLIIQRKKFTWEIRSVVTLVGLRIAHPAQRPQHEECTDARQGRSDPSAYSFSRSPFLAFFSVVGKAETNNNNKKE